MCQNGRFIRWFIADGDEETLRVVAVDEELENSTCFVEWFSRLVMSLKAECKVSGLKYQVILSDDEAESWRDKGVSEVV